MNDTAPQEKYQVDVATMAPTDFAFSEDRLALLDQSTIDWLEDGSYVGSVDLTKVVGVTHPRYGGHTWGELKPVATRELSYLRRAHDNLQDLNENPGYYISDAKKHNWSFYQVGEQFYVESGVHRTVLARYFLDANKLPQVVHGVHICKARWRIAPRQTPHFSYVETTAPKKVGTLVMAALGIALIMTVFESLVRLF